MSGILRFHKGARHLKWNVPPPADIRQITVESAAKEEYGYLETDKPVASPPANKSVAQRRRGISGGTT
jgi:hypothetical protein